VLGAVEVAAEPSGNDAAICSYPDRIRRAGANLLLADSEDFRPRLRSTLLDAFAKPPRPPFMVTLGLLPPYTPEDVQAAYREKAKTTHPDRGGSVAEFEQLHEAYERAQEYLKFHQDRRQWLAVQVERYAAQAKVVDEVRRLGGTVEEEELDWIKQSFGDFAVVTEMLRGIRLRGAAKGDAFLKYLAEHAAVLQYLLWLDVSGSQISDQGVAQLAALKSLRRLDVSRTPISDKALRVVKRLPDLEWLNLTGTSIGWWARWRLRYSFPHLRVLTTFVAKGTNHDLGCRAF
jgi:hypothetical protein